MSFAIKNGLFKFNITDHHAILGVPLNADIKQIRLNYLKIAQKLHPDTCKADKNQKKLANDLLAKLVNPAYKKISNKNSYAEYQLILTQIGNRLAGQVDKMTIATEPAKELLQSGNKLELVYYKLVKNLATKEYQSLEETISYIAQLSELNLVYLMLSQKQPSRKENLEPTKATNNPKNPKAKSPSNTIQSTPEPQENNEESIAKARIDSFIRRAREYMAKNNFVMAISELRGALKIDPNHSTCHGLLGKAYLHQNQLTMAKVHINKALNTDPKDPIAIEAKELLDKLEKQHNKGNKSKSTSSGIDKSTSGSIFGSLFGTKKK